MSGVGCRVSGGGCRVAGLAENITNSVKLGLELGLSLAKKRTDEKQEQPTDRQSLPIKSFIGNYDKYFNHF